MVVGVNGELTELDFPCCPCAHECHHDIIVEIKADFDHFRIDALGKSLVFLYVREIRCNSTKRANRYYQIHRQNFE